MTRQLVGLVLAAVILAQPEVSHAQASSMTEAQAAVEAWLSLIDQGDFAQTYATAASLFKKAVAQEAWQTAAGRAREPLGRLKSRALKSATVTKTLPGAPDGDYVVFQFDASFDQKAAAVETVTAIREPDQSWHVGGYFIK